VKPEADNHERREHIIAALLWYGTWLASAVIAVGIILGALDNGEGVSRFAPGGHTVVKAGVALFIFLPVMRVALMLGIFLRERDWAYTAISALVLAIIGIGIVVAL
jgi:uncharacterized membrane protein